MKLYHVNFTVGILKYDFYVVADNGAEAVHLAQDKLTRDMREVTEVLALSVADEGFLPPSDEHPGGEGFVVGQTLPRKHIGGFAS